MKAYFFDVSSTTLSTIAVVSILYFATNSSGVPLLGTSFTAKEWTFVTRRNYPPGGGYFSRIHNSWKLSPPPLKK